MDSKTSTIYLVPLLASALLIFLLHSLAVSNLLSPTSKQSNTASSASSAQPTTKNTTQQSKNTAPGKRSNNNKRNRKNNQNKKMSSPATTSPTTAPAKAQPASHSRDTTQCPPSPSSSVAETLVEDARVRQPFDAFLVVDFEATCVPGGGFDYPNEIIEFPVVLLEWADMDSQTDRRAAQLVKVAEFRSYVQPTWRPQLSSFCTALTGITQTDVDTAPPFTTTLQLFESFLAQHGLIDPLTCARLKKFVFASDGPFDVRDFVAKQCYIANIPVPSYFQSDVLDVRKAVSYYSANRESGRPMLSTTTTPSSRSTSSKNKRYANANNIDGQLKTMGLEAFEGRLHCGIDDARNIARILTALAATPMRLEPNTFIHPNRRWWWMVRDGSGRVDFPSEEPEQHAANGEPPAYSSSGPPSYYSPPPTSHVVLSSPPPAPVPTLPSSGKVQVQHGHHHGHSHTHSWGSASSSMGAGIGMGASTTTTAVPSVASSESLSSLGLGLHHSNSAPTNPYAHAGFKPNMTRTRTNSSSSSSSNELGPRTRGGFEMDANVVETLGSLGLWMPAPKSPSLTLRSATAVEKEKVKAGAGVVVAVGESKLSATKPIAVAVAA